MPPNSSNVKSAYTSKMTLYLEKRKNGEIQAAKVDLTKINITTSAKRIGVLSEGVKMYMYLSNAKRYDRTINLLRTGDVDMSATTGEAGENKGGHPSTFSDAEVKETAKKEKEVELFTVGKNRTRAGGSFFPYLNITIFGLSKYCIFENN